MSILFYLFFSVSSIYSFSTKEKGDTRSLLSWLAQIKTKTKRYFLSPVFVFFMTTITADPTVLIILGLLIFILGMYEGAKMTRIFLPPR